MLETPLNNQKISSKSGKGRVRIIHEVLGVLAYKLINGEKLGCLPIDKDIDIDKQANEYKETIEFRSMKKTLMSKDGPYADRLKEIEKLEPGLKKRGKATSARKGN